MSDEERKVREKERKRKAREKESEEAKSARLEYQRKYRADQKEKMTEDEREESLRAKREVEAARRANLSDQERSEMLTQRRESEAAHRASMSEEERAEMLKQKSKAKAVQRGSMSEEQRAEMLKRRQELEAAHRASMSEEEKAQMLKEKSKAKAVQRGSMSEAQRAEMLKRRHELEAAHRASMTEEEKAQMLKQKSTAESVRRENMPEEHRAEILKKKRSGETERREKAKMKVLTIKEASLNFQKKCKDLPEFVCTVCHRLLWRRSVVAFKESSYNFACDVVKRCFAAENRKETRPNQVYVCTTCHNDLKRKKPLMPAQAVANGLKLPPQPNIPLPNDLERRLFSLACPFMKIGGLPRGGQFRLQGPCINVPTNLQSVCEFLPRLPDEAGVILLKFKRKLSYKGHYMYDTVRPAVVLAWLQWLKENNPLYKDIDVRSNWNQLLSQYEQQGKLRF